MNDFTLLLPAEALHDIFSYIDQSTCIQCVCVCLNWYQRIPAYTRDIWKEITVSPDSWSTSNDCLIQCLGPHLQKVSVHSMDATNVLRAFKYKHCEIKSLEIITDAKPKDHDGLLSAISQFQDTLTELTIVDYSTSLSWVQLLRLHNLTHLTRVGGALVSHDPEHDPITAIQPMTSLIYLELDGIFDFDTELVPILRCCPNIMSLVVSMDYQMTSEGIEPSSCFDMIFDQCPNLHYIAWNTVVAVAEVTEIINRWKQLRRIDDIVKGVVRQFIYWGRSFDFEQVFPMVKRSAHELECLRIGSSECNWNGGSESLADMHFSRLNTLMMSGMEMTEDEWVRLLTRCEKLERLSVMLAADEVSLDALIAAIHGSMKQLKRFRLVDYEYFTQMDHSQVCRKFGLFSQNTALESLDLGICCAGNVLDDLCEIPSLKELKLKQSSVHRTCVHVDDLLAFSDKLKDTNIHTLALRDFTNITDDVLERFGQVEQLEHLSIAGSASITQTGVNQFFSNYGKELDTSDCRILNQTTRE
ncbi:hypothetical protein BJV82DRAFT_708824 [Fennellomyces sp. T-0311]|nr:hypothetical protein BJV82DRAFT_708824 [Fennellomyces sp. T-0311]